jgi:hypothetical protein
MLGLTNLPSTARRRRLAESTGPLWEKVAAQLAYEHPDRWGQQPERIVFNLRAVRGDGLRNPLAHVRLDRVVLVVGSQQRLPDG